MFLPDPSEYHPFFKGYVALVPETDSRPLFLPQLEELLAAFHGVPEANTEVPHGKYTWTIKQVLGHLIDGEKIFGYRAHCIAHGDKTPLSSFDQNAYIQAANHTGRKLESLLKEFQYSRLANNEFFQSLPEAQWKQVGVAGKHPLSVTALGHVMIGHVRHHMAVLQKRLSGNVA